LLIQFSIPLKFSYYGWITFTSVDPWFNTIEAPNLETQDFRIEGLIGGRSLYIDINVECVMDVIDVKK